MTPKCSRILNWILKQKKVIGRKIGKIQFNKFCTVVNSVVPRLIFYFDKHSMVM